MTDGAVASADATTKPTMSQWRSGRTPLPAQPLFRWLRQVYQAGIEFVASLLATALTDFTYTALCEISSLHGSVWQRLKLTEGPLFWLR